MIQEGDLSTIAMVDLAGAVLTNVGLLERTQGPQLAHMRPVSTPAHVAGRPGREDIQDVNEGLRRLQSLNLACADEAEFIPAPFQIGDQFRIECEQASNPSHFTVQ